MNKPNPLAQSDEDFLNGDPFPQPAEDDKAGSTSTEADEDAHNAGDPPVEDDDGAPVEPHKALAEGEEDPAPDGEEVDGDADPEEEEEGEQPDGEADPAAADPHGSKGDKPDKDAKEDEPAGEQSTFSVPTAFQANGKTIELKNQEEAVRLMQMGANYTRKMQELAPHRKLLLMLQNNGLTDEDRLSFLIDLDQKNPEAIKKLIKDSGIDPLEIDVESDSNYFGSSHSVTEEEVNFRTVMDDLRNDPKGTETITTINSDMDEDSKEVIWKQPEILTVIHEHRQSGIYDQIKAEMDRQITLGKLPANTPFLAAYKQVGDELVAASGVTPPAGQQQSGVTEGQPGLATRAPTPVATRVAAPKPKVSNGDKAGAAASTRGTSSQNKAPVNPLAMADDAFLKDMENRL